jgi:hypothetical protein
MAACDLWLAGLWGGLSGLGSLGPGDPNPPKKHPLIICHGRTCETVEPSNFDICYGISVLETVHDL